MILFTIPDKKHRIQYILQNNKQLRNVDKMLTLSKIANIFVRYRQICRLTIMHARFVILKIVGSLCEL